MAKNKKITDENKAFYRLGKLNGESQLKHTLEVLHKTNNTLWEELMRLDRDEPRVGVLITYELLQHIIKNAKTDKRSYYMAKLLTKMGKKAREKDAKAALLSIEENPHIEL